MAIDQATGVISWAPMPNDVGPHAVTVRVEDGRGGVDEQSFTIEVLNNRPPKIISTPVTDAFTGAPYSYDVDATDPDGDPLTYSLPTAPAGMAIDANSGRIAWEVPSERSEPASVIALGAPGEANPPYEDAHAVATDAQGFVYVAGHLRGTADFDPGPGVVPATGLAYVAKYAPDGSLVWARAFDRAADAPPGSAVEMGAYDVAVDTAGNVLISGAGFGRIDLDPGPGSSPFDAGGGGAFVVKLDPGGGFLWGRGITSANAGYGNSVTSDGQGDVFLSGTFNQFDEVSDLDPGPGVYTVDTGGADASFVEKLTPDGDFAWAFTSGATYAPGVTADADGNAYALFSGWTLRKLSPAGQPLWEAPLHLNGAAEAVALDRSGNVYVTGSFSGAGWIDTPSGRIDLSSTKSAAVVAKFGPDGQAIWARQPTGEGTSEADGVAVGADGQVAVTGRLWSGALDFDPGPEVHLLDSGPDYNGFAWVLDPDGHYVWAGSLVSTEHGSLIGVSPYDVTIEPSGRVLVAGYFSGTADFDPGPGVLSRTAGGDTDAFLARLTPPPSHYDVTVRVDDGRGGSDEQSFTIDVSSAASEQIRGTVYDDQNGNGNRDDGEPGLPGWTLYLDQNGNGVHDPNETSTTSDPNGDYAFDNLLPGTYTVAEETPGGWNQNAPAGHTYAVTVSDGQVVTGLDFGNHQVAGPPLNQPPRFTSTPPTAATAGQALRYDVSASDPDSDPLSYDLVVKPAGMAVDPTTGVLVWTPTADQLGVQDVVLRVQDGRGGVDLQSFQITVGRANSVPVITSTPRGPAVVGLPWQYQVTAQDADGDPITFSLGAHPDGMAIDSSTGMVAWTPPADQAGQSPHVEVNASDNRGASTTESFDLPVVANATDRPPVIDSTPRASIRLGSTYLYQILASDPDGDPLAYSLPVHPQGMTIDPATGLVTWTPNGDQLGSNDVQLRVDDGRGMALLQTFAVAVLNQAANHPPRITSTPPGSAIIGMPYAYDLKANDPDGDPLSWSFDAAPAGVSIDPALGTLRWTPTDDQLGDQTFIVRVIDGQGGSAAQTFTVTVRGVNSPPGITSAPPTTASVGNAYAYAIRANDPDDDPLTFTLTTHPDGMAIDPQTGLITWTPDASQASPQDVAVRVEDGQGGVATQPYTIVVSAAAEDHAPVITSTPSYVATVGVAYQYAVTATDADGDTLSFQLLAKPDGMVIDPTTGLVTWTPRADQIGPATVTLAAIDGQFGGTQTYTLTVVEPDQPPAIHSTPPMTITAGLPYRYDVRADDPDGDPLTYRLDEFPDGMAVDGLGRLNWAPGITDIGIHHVILKVDDGRGLSATQPFDITVVPDTQAPRVNLVVTPNPVDLGTTIFAFASATDDVGVVSRGVTVNGVAVPLDGAGNIVLPGLVAGTYDIIATASDAAGNVGSASATLQIIGNPGGTMVPDVELTSPAEDAVITAPVDVMGSVLDDNLTDYTLSVAPASGGPFVEIARGTTTVDHGILGKFDPSGLANDSYILRLQAIDGDGNVVTLDTMIDVAGDLKLGNFTLSFTDLTIPAAGLPITVARTYDSLNANTSADFGYGWRLEFRDTLLRTSLPAPTPEEADAGIFPAYRDGTRVYVTLPGGKREGFTFEPASMGGFLGGFFRPEFVPDSGVTDRLASMNVTLLQVGTEYYEPAIGGPIPYNPADALNFGGTFTLSTKDGAYYSIDANSGLLLAAGDPVGNTLTFTDDAITSSDGQAVTFDRDPQGRIVAVTDLLGRKVSYRYDAAGDLVAVTDRDGNVTQFAYDAPGHPHYLTRVIDPLGRTGVRNEYDAQGRLTRLIDAAGNPVVLAYDPDQSLETVTDALGNPTTYVYDAFGNVVTEVDALGGRTERTYDSANNLLSETDPLGRTTSYTYDVDGNVLTTTDPLGNVTRSTYATVTPPPFTAHFFGARSLRLLATTTDPLGNTTTYAYANDGSGLLTATTDAAGQVTRYTYDTAGDQTSITDPAGNVTHFTYDGAGHLLSQTDPLGHQTTYTYDANGNPLTESTTLTTPAGVRTLVTTTASDANGRPVSVTDAEGHTTTTEYDADGHQTATVDALGHRTTFLYDARGQLVETDFADGTKTTTTYDADGRRIAATDRAGRVTRFIYDDIGRLVQTIEPDDTPGDNPTTQTVYDAAGQVSAQIDELGHRTEFEYDAAGRQTLVRDALGHTTATTYDAAGRRTSTTDALGHTTSFSYDSLGRLTQTTFVDGTTTSTAYDVLGRAITQTDQLGRTTHFEYDSLGRLTAVVDALGQRTEYGYDEAGDLVSQTDADGHVTRFEYDGLGRRTATVLPLGQRSDTTYDPVGNVASTTDFNRQTTLFDDDSSNRLIAEHFPDGTTTSFTYTPTGQRATITDARGRTTYVYDARDRLVSRTDPDGTTISYTYDPAGDRTSVTIPAGTTSYTFDALGRLATVTDPSGGLTRYTYDAVGNLTHTDLPDGTTETRQYDALNRLVDLEDDGPGGVISSYRYTLAATGRRDAVVEDNGRRVDYHYDLLDRLIDELITDPIAGDRSMHYVYDPVGNRLSRDDSAEGLTTSTYDANDRLLTETLAGRVTTYTYDDNGNTTSRIAGAVDQVFYHWDSQNRLIDADTTDATGTHHIVYKYDADGIRVASIVDGAETRFLIDANQPYAQVLEEYTPGGVIQVSYVYGNDLISQDRGGVRSYYHVDGLGSTRALTNASGVVTDRYIYDAFGRTIGQVGTTVNVYLFAGEQRDFNVGLDYLRARYLSAGAGRFYGMDPSEGDPQSPVTLHRYLYANGNPISNKDPSGRVTLAEVLVTTAIVDILATSQLFAAPRRLASEGEIGTRLSPPDKNLTDKIIAEMAKKLLAKEPLTPKERAKIIAEVLAKNFAEEYILPPGKQDEFKKKFTELNRPKKLGLIGLSAAGVAAAYSLGLKLPFSFSVNGIHFEGSIQASRHGTEAFYNAPEANLKITIPFNPRLPGDE